MWIRELHSQLHRNMSSWCERPWKQSSAVQQTIISPRREHSRKPEEARRRIEEFFGNNISRIELFAREQGFEGWQVWGNDTSKFSPC